jgi:hypothetical protein
MKREVLFIRTLRRSRDFVKELVEERGSCKLIEGQSQTNRPSMFCQTKSVTRKSLFFSSQWRGFNLFLTF